MCLSACNTRHVDIALACVLTYIQVSEETSYVHMLLILQAIGMMAEAAEPPQGEPTTPVSDVILACLLCRHMSHVNLKHVMIMMSVFVCAAALHALFCVWGLQPMPGCGDRLRRGRAGGAALVLQRGGRGRSCGGGGRGDGGGGGRAARVHLHTLHACNTYIAYMFVLSCQTS